VATEQEGTSFGPVDESGVDFGRSAMNAEQESGYSPGGFAERVAAEDDRVTPGNLFASQSLPPRNIPPMPGAVAPPPPPLSPVFTPVPGAPVQPFSAAPVPPAHQVPPVAPVAPVVASAAGPTGAVPPVPPQPAAPVPPSAPQGGGSFDPFAGATPPPAAHVAPVAPVPPAAQPVAPVAPVAPPAATAGLGAPIAATGFTTTVSNPILPPVPPAPTKSRARRLAPLVAAPLVLVLAGGAFAAYQVGVFGAPGTQPSAVVPATAVAYAAVDLNPSAEAKLGVYEFSRHFPSTKGVSKDSFKDNLLAEMATEIPELDYAKDLAPWVGDRVGVAAIPDSATDAGFQPLVVIETKDEEKADAFLTKADGRVDDDSTLHWTFRDGYALIAPTAAVVQAAAEAEDTLEDNSVYSADRARLGDDVLAHAWVDTAAIVKALPAEEAAEVPQEVKDRLSGSAVVGAAVTGDYFELTGQATGYDIPAGDPTKNLDAMPAGATAAFAITGLGPALTEVYEQAEASGLTERLPVDEVGLTLPEDINAIFGTDFAVAVEADQPAVFTKVTTEDPEASAEVVDGLLNANGSLGVEVEATDDGYTAALNDWSADGTLTDDPKFTEAVPHADGARSVGYVDFAPIIAQWEASMGSTTTTMELAEGVECVEGCEDEPTADDERLANAKALKAAGYSLNADGENVSFTFRLTVGD
jgi:hypothetical protein